MAGIAKPRKTPIFAFQSRFDSDQRSCEMGPLCRLSTSCVKAYAGNGMAWWDDGMMLSEAVWKRPYLGFVQKNGEPVVCNLMSYTKVAICPVLVWSF